MIMLIEGFGRRLSNRLFERRLVRWDRGDVELTEDEGQRYLASCDPDIVLITEYLGDELAPDDCAAVEERAATDEAFGEKFCTILYGGSVKQEDLDLNVVAAERRRGSRWLAGFACLGVLVTVFIGRVAIGRALQRAAERAEDRASTVDFFMPTVVSTSTGDTTLGMQGMDVAVRRESRLTYGFQVRHSGGVGLLALDGEAAFHSWSVPFLVRTATSVIHAKPGRFAIRSVPFSGATQISVDSGLVFIERPGTESDAGSAHQVLAVVRPGERAIVERNGAVTIAKGGIGFPVCAFAPPVGSRERDRSTAQLRFLRTNVDLMTAVDLTHKSWR